MEIYKYPIKYFCGSGLTRFSKELIQQSFDTFSRNRPIKIPITGETGIEDLLIDFNYGLRLQIPEGNWHVRIIDSRSELVFLDDDLSGVTLISMEKFYVEWEIAIWLDGEPVFYHQFDPTGQQVHFNFAHKTLGDTVALLTYVEAFRKTFDCDVTISSPKVFHDIIKNYYPNVRLVNELPADSYACFYIGAFVNMPIAATAEARGIPLLQIGQTILNTPKIPRPSKVIYTPTKPRSIEQKYVCIGVQASGNSKCWLNPGGWDQVVKYLKSLGYRVLCIDRDRKCNNCGMTVKMPCGAEDFSGKYNLIDRVNQLAYADFFIGLGSGLSWLAWAVDIPVVLISGFSEPWCEFDTPYRVYNPLVCHGCFNDLAVDIADTVKCIRRDEPDLKFECSKKISARMVINAIDRLIADHKLEVSHEHL